jgi:rSAM/selenodomain-associated transferase 1
MPAYMGRMNDEGALIIFVRNLQHGKVKTRLAKTAGHDKAFAIYRVLLNYTRHITQDLDSAKYIYYSDYIDYLDSWSEEIFIKRKQDGTDLGGKMAHAFEEVLKAHNRVIIIGSDCPELEPLILRKAIDALEYFDVVLGPTVDGGYYMLGLSDFYPELFKDIPWSSERVLESTIDILEKLKLTYLLFPKLQDVDLESDWNVLGWDEKLKDLPD